MAVYKCKMCGGELNLVEGQSVVECEYCGSKQTVPTADNEKKMTLFTRANRLLRNCEFDKASGVFESIVADFPEEAEAYWGLVLCKYGIEYVDDPATGKKVPTCHRSSFESVMDVPNFEQACEFTDAVARRVYRDEARQIEALREAILEVSGKEEPYDIFISYKEKDPNGERTKDSVIAQDIYKALTDEGYRVFFSRISLESKLGTEYEPYIFAALNSARVMLVVGTDYENFDAVWVKNEWSRYLKLIASGQKKTLIPVFKDMDAYDMPKEFSKFAAQDMGKIGAMQDLLHGVEKILGKKKQPEPAAAPAPQQVVQQVVSGGPNVSAMLARGQQALEDGGWDAAKGFYDRALDMDANCAEAFLGKYLAAAHVADYAQALQKRRALLKNEQKEQPLQIKANREAEEEAVRGGVVPDYLTEQEIRQRFQSQPLDYPSTRSYWQTAAKSETELLRKCLDSRDLERAHRYAGDALKTQLQEAERAHLAAIEAELAASQEREAAAKAKTEKENAAFLARACAAVGHSKELAEERRRQDYDAAKAKAEQAKNSASLTESAKEIAAFGDYADAKERAAKLRQQAAEKQREEQAEAARKAAEAERARQRAAAKRKRILTVISAVCVAAVAALIVVTKVIIPNNNYNKAVALMEAGQYEEAIVAFEALGGYKDSSAQIENCQTAIKDTQYNAAVALLESGNVIDGYESLIALGGYKDSADRAEAVYAEYKAEKLKTASVGDIVIFGAYEQDNNTSNGKEDIEWIVLAKEDGRLLIISKYALDCQQYNTSRTDVTWETCTLRGWLNDTFLNGAFSSEEQAMIQTSTVSADKNPEYSTSPGNAKQDKVFLLSIAEAEKYFSSNSARQAAPTSYAIAQDAYTSDTYKTASGEAACWWWLRSPGSHQSNAAFVNCDGSLNCNGYHVSFRRDAVRPALWIDLDS